MKSSTKLVYRKSDPPSEKGFYDSEAGVIEDNESTDKLDSRLNSRHKGSGISGKPCKIIVSILLLLLALYQIWASLMRLYPEWNMAIHSTCKIRTRGWNGKIPLLNLRIGYNRNEHRPRSYNVYHRVNATGDRRRLGEWFLPPEVSTSEFALDNASVVAVSLGGGKAARTKHYDIRMAFLRSQVEAKAVMVVHIPTELQVADMMTKVLARGPQERHEKEAMNIGVYAAKEKRADKVELNDKGEIVKIGFQWPWEAELERRRLLELAEAG